MQWKGFSGTVAEARAESESSEAASLNGHKALTPIITGSICGGVLAIAWIVGLVFCLLKRRKSKGRDPPNETDETERYIIPPDPAILQGYRKPDEQGAHVSV
ncbi:uncharacterized protein EDB91DRAFT_1085051 [Suillus paluster]|uniref:uncharacterized protein n=1 Tax=Suillus paluster TaxID=48578 RepID=UPI001B86DBDD|nr:uncharacterized protein EDB91DRAFT_1085051 [Suillus paluster]KAG1731506.1 hypothetical protein EDB91DRAFT_1085051 [Suillus paluster]